MSERLVIEYRDLETFRREYHRNIANGGAFVPSSDTFEPRQPVRVDLVLSFCDLEIPLQAEVVGVGTPDLAQGGGRAGVAVQFQMPAEQLRQHLYGEIARVLPDALPRVWPKARGLTQRAERSDARVRAILTSPLGMQDCRTRDLSRTGALISIGGPPVAVGEMVNVTLAHPRTREELTLHARVVRHEKTGGRVGAVAVHFDVPVERRSYAIRFLEEVRATARAKRRSAIQGPVSVLGLANLVQMFSSATECGSLIVKRGSDEGRIVFEGGALRHARIGRASGVKAVSRLLENDTGIFEFYAEVDEDEPKDEGGPMYGVVLEAMTFVDELRRVDLSPFPGSARARATPAGEGETPQALDKLEAMILGMTAGGIAIRDLLDAIPEFDALIYSGLHALLERDQIRVERSHGIQPPE